ncbi:hypothetical protein FH972_022629 [Carpinus fangiana]|uniref:VWFA domain-containing protein n=1 Tax=Carpinus fangiana TaxID=176857 RepID=A0A5N6KTB5_9ROSI|nr:hypothetical protein FH972_022629 [Carpinus fangiana]
MSFSLPNISLFDNSCLVSPRVQLLIHPRTGATGFIGGDAFHALNAKHPDWAYTCLVRNSDKGAAIAKDYPRVRLVYGDLDSAELVEKEAADADVVANFASADHLAGINSIIAGIKSSEKPAHLVHTSGTGVLLFPDIEAKTYGEARSKVWDDVKDIDAIINDIPDTAPHRKIDLAILNSGLSTSAIVCPPTIYGAGRGANPRSVQVPMLTSATLQRKQGFFIGEGKSYWCEVHVHDLSDLYVLLIEDAISGGKTATWGPQGYYYAENGEFVWGDICRAVAKEAHKQGLLDSADCESLSAEHAEAMSSHSSFLVGTNSRSRASRARQVLGWSPSREGLLSTIPQAVQHEAGLIKTGQAPNFNFIDHGRHKPNEIDNRGDAVQLSKLLVERLHRRRVRALVVRLLPIARLLMLALAHRLLRQRTKDGGQGGLQAEVDREDVGLQGGEGWTGEAAECYYAADERLLVEGNINTMCSVKSRAELPDDVFEAQPPRHTHGESDLRVIMAEKEATVYVVDLGKSMGEKRNSRNETDLDWCMKYVWDKITTTIATGRKTACLGVVGFRTDTTENDLAGEDGYENISVLQPIAQALMPDVRALSQKIKPSRTNNGDAISAVVVALMMMEKFTKKLKYIRRIVLVTDGRGALDPDNIDDIAQKAAADGVELVILGADFDDPEYGVKEEDKDTVKKYNEDQFADFANKCNGVFGTMQQAIEEMSIPRVKGVRPVPSYKGILTLGNPQEYETAMAIDVERYPRTMIAKALSASNYVVRSESGPSQSSSVTLTANVDKDGDVDMVKKEQDDGATIKLSRTYQVFDESAPGGKREVERDSLAKGYEYGRTAVHMSESEENVTKFEADQCLEIVGFVPAENVSRLLLFIDSADN